MSFNIIVKNYEHFNRALPNWHSPKGRYISSQSQYERECRDANLIPYEQAQSSTPSAKPKYSKDTVEFLEHIKEKTDKKGNVKLSDKEIKFMIDKGAIKDRSKFDKHLPKDLPLKGGFSRSK